MMHAPAAHAQSRPEAFRAAEASTFLRLFGFVGDSIVDGPGLRCVIFAQGCPHACPGCHNPDSHPFCGGTDTDIDTVYANIKKYPLCRGITFSGGEPFSQAGPLALLAARLKAQGYELAAYTGYTFEQLLRGTPEQKALLQQLDTIIDGRFELSQRNLSLRFRGSANQRILDVQQSLAQQAPVWETAPRWVGEG